MQFFKQQRALGFSRASLIIGICFIAAYFLSIMMIILTESYGLELFFLYAFPLTALIGLVLGVIGLIGCIRRESHSTKGIVYASIGIALTLEEAAFAVFILLFAMMPDTAARPL